MDLLHNPIADMYGPAFLLLYGIVIVTIFVGCWLIQRFTDNTASLLPPAIPPRPDPYEIAYLRGGEVAVACTVIFSLFQRRYLQATTDTPQRIERSALAPAPSSLSPLEQTVYDWFDTPHTANEIFTPSHNLAVRLQPYCHAYEQKHRSEGLLTSPAMRWAARWAWLAGACIIAGLGTYKFIVALIKGHSNVGFLILMGIVSLFFLLILFMRRGVPRLTQRGKAYLKRLQMTFSSLSRQPIARDNSEAIDTAGSLAVALFGMGLLAGTSYGFYAEMLKQTIAANSSYWGSSGDSGNFGGGTCGGSGGGCGSGDGGGGGCGGCGGA